MTRQLVGFELRLDLNPGAGHFDRASSGRSRDRKRPRTGFALPVGFELRLDLNPGARHFDRLHPFGQEDADHDGIQVETELEPYRHLILRSAFRGLRPVGQETEKGRARDSRRR